MDRYNSIIDNEKGSTLVVALLILVLLTLMGLAATNSTNIENQISGNEKWHTKTFFGADAGSQVGIRLLISSIDVMNCNPADYPNIGIANPPFYMNTAVLPQIPSDTSRDVFFPINYNANPLLPMPHTNLRFTGNTTLSHGNAIQMAAGYDGFGKSAAWGGNFVLYDVISQRIDLGNSEAVVYVRLKYLY